MMDFQPAEHPLSDELSLKKTKWQIVFQNRKLLIERIANDQIRLPPPASLADIQLNPVREHYLGTLNNTPCYVIEITTLPDFPPNLCLETLRSLSLIVDNASFAIAGRGFQVLEWDRNHRFCSRCGTRLPRVKINTIERVKRCHSCGLNHYPRVTPAVIMLVKRDKEVLLSRSPHFRAGMYSVQAGFVEAGESLEQAVMREIQEEVGLQIKNLRYFGSQSWPFPHSLMLGFMADYASGELTVNLNELEEAGWYHVDNLPSLLPSPVSIAHDLIQHFIKEVT